MYIRILVMMLALIASITLVGAATTDLNSIREVTIGDTGGSNSILEEFMSPIRSYFFAPGIAGKEGITGSFAMIAYQIKNFFIAIAVIFLIVGVIRLLFSANDEEDQKKWKKSIIWTSVGIFVMQIAYSVWQTLILNNTSDKVGSSLGWTFWVNIFAPIVELLQMLAAFGFLFMAVWAFFILVTAGGDEEKTKKAKNTILYAIIGFFLIKIPYQLVKSIYGRSPCEDGITLRGCDITNPKISDTINIVGKIFTYFNTFLTVICVLLVIYAGWLVLISGGEEEKLKKAKSTILYIVIGFIILIASHAIFRFFILKG